MASRRVVILPVLGTAALLMSCAAHAEFYRWIDSSGQARVSNIPPQGVRSDGSVSPAFNPSAIAVQQAALRARLQARDTALQAASQAAQSSADAEVESSGAGTARSK